MTATISTLFHEFPLVFAIRVGISIFMISASFFIAIKLCRQGKINNTQRNIMMFLSVYIVLMLYLTVLGRYSWSVYRYDFDVLGAYRRLIYNRSFNDVFQFLINALMTVPVGFLTPALFKKHKYLNTIICCAVLILAIEFLQFFTRTGTFETVDIINNIIGAVLGIAACAAVRKIYKQVREKE